MSNDFRTTANHNSTMLKFFFISYLISQHSPHQDQAARMYIIFKSAWLHRPRPRHINRPSTRLRSKPAFTTLQAMEVPDRVQASTNKSPNPRCTLEQISRPDPSKCFRPWHLMMVRTSSNCNVYLPRIILLTHAGAFSPYKICIFKRKQFPIVNIINSYSVVSHTVCFSWHFITSSRFGGIRGWSWSKNQF